MKTKALPYWLVAKRKTGPLEALVVADVGRGKTLPVFCSRRGAEVFASLEAPDPGWCARECSAGELVSLLYGLCSSTRTILVDPPPRSCRAPSPRAFGKREFVDLLARLSGSTRPAHLHGFVGELS